VTLADMCLGLLRQAIADHPLGGQTLLAVLSPRGYPLGEHLGVGPAATSLYGELLHVPLLIRFPDERLATARSHEILQPHRLGRLLENTSAFTDETSLASGAVAVAKGSREQAIRTPAWFMRQSVADDGPRDELFAKPDDRWEANEVSSRCGRIVELLAAELDRFHSAGAAGTATENGPLPEALSDIWR
jgi:hypothetical protein